MYYVVYWLLLKQQWRGFCTVEKGSIIMHLSPELVMVLWDVTSHTRIWYVPCDRQPTMSNSKAWGTTTTDSGSQLELSLLRPQVSALHGTRALFSYIQTDLCHVNCSTYKLSAWDLSAIQHAILYAGRSEPQNLEVLTSIDIHSTKAMFFYKGHVNCNNFSCSITIPNHFSIACNSDTKIASTLLLVVTHFEN